MIAKTSEQHYLNRDAFEEFRRRTTRRIVVSLAGIAAIIAGFVWAIGR